MANGKAGRTGRHGIADNAERLRRIESLLGHYPDIEEEEQAEIVAFLKKGPVLDLALLSGVERIRPQLERFRKDHRRALGPSPKEMIILAGAVALFLLACFFLWDVGVG